MNPAPPVTRTRIAIAAYLSANRSKPGGRASQHLRVPMVAYLFRAGHRPIRSKYVGTEKVLPRAPWLFRSQDYHASNCAHVFYAIAEQRIMTIAFDQEC